MSRLSKALLIMGSFLGGIAPTFVLVAVYVGLTYHCQLGPCDAGAMTAFGLIVLFGPIIGMCSAFYGYRFIVRRERTAQ